VRQQRSLWAAAALAAVGLTGVAAILPARLQRALVAAADRLTDRIVQAAADAWTEDVA
jgi:hypothetical protein